ncbi:MAG: PilC/PilY family type IV pilus protein [Desulfobia sp.]
MPHKPGIVISSVFSLLLIFLTHDVQGFSEPNNSTYECQPVFLSSSVQPNILIILDNSGSMNELSVPPSESYAGPPVGNSKYYGYFNPDYFYRWDGNKFIHQYKKIEYAGTPGSDGYWQVKDLNGNTRTLHDTEIEAGDSSGLWDGNFMNYAAMRKIDVVRKVIMGGLATSRQGGGNQINIGEASTRYYNHDLQDPGPAITPFSGSKIYEVYNGYLDIYSNWPDWQNWNYDGRYRIRIDKQEEYEPRDFVDGNLAGVLQKVGDRARWGNEWFNYGTGNNESGGYIASTIGANMNSLITDLQNTPADTWTPLAEAYYVAGQYFAQEDIDYSATSDYKNNLVPNNNLGDDPYYNGSEMVSCAKSFAILLTDGASTMDADIPSYLADYDNDGNDTACTTGDEANYNTCDYYDAGTDYLDDLALYYRTTDLRSAGFGKTNLPGSQHLNLYTVFASFGTANPEAESLLKNAAINGGFVDLNGNNLPDQVYEWDNDDDGNPDTYYRADNGYKLEQNLLNAIYNILKRASSGSAVSVLSGSAEGEGTLTQAFFYPRSNRQVRSTSSISEFKWLGHLNSFFVDSKGNLREDTPDAFGAQDQKLDITRDKVISFIREDNAGTECYGGETRIRVCEVNGTSPYPNPGRSCTPPSGCNDWPLDSSSYHPLWSADRELAATTADDLAGTNQTYRHIFTYIDINNDGEVDDPGFSGTTGQWQGGTPYSQFDHRHEIVEFSTGSSTEITPYLGVGDDAAWNYLGATLNTRADNLIKWVRGRDINGLRTRTFDHDDDIGTVDQTWKLGDIIHSQPRTVSEPVENYHVIYADESYQHYYDAFKHRETMVYVGANDGMLHAFTSWEYNATTKKFNPPAAAPGDENIGTELWAYIPQNLLPHLKWLPDPNYVHTYYVDLTPKIFDARILADDTHYSDADHAANWGTFLLGGFRLGGGTIEAQEDFDYDGSVTGNETRTFSPGYFLIDITEPRNPKVLWEKTYENLQATTSFPAVIRVQDKWFAVFGSGPSGCSGKSSQSGRLYIVDLATGEPYRNNGNDWLFATDSNNAFVNSPVTLDKKLNFNVDAIYFGEATNTRSSDQGGKIHKILIPWECDSTNFTKQQCYENTAHLNYGHYIDEPDNATSPWFRFELFDAGEPVTAPLSLSLDRRDNIWVYGGTGRFFSSDDKNYTNNQYLFGLKDPFYNRNYAPDDIEAPGAGEYYRNYSGSMDQFSANMTDVTGLVIGSDSRVYSGPSLSYQGTFDQLISEIRDTDGWIRTITGRERNLEKPLVLGGDVFFSTFTPSSGVCSSGGSSRLYGLYYETGTAYPEAIFNNSSYEEIIDSDTVTLNRTYIDLGRGVSSRMQIHVGETDGAKGFVQKSTGEITIKEVNPSLDLKSGLYYWKN